MPFCGPEISFPEKYIGFFCFPFFFFAFDFFRLVAKRKWKEFKRSRADPDSIPAEETPLFEEVQRILLVDIRMFYVTLSTRTFDMLSCTPMLFGQSFLAGRHCGAIMLGLCLGLCLDNVWDCAWRMFGIMLG